MRSRTPTERKSQRLILRSPIAATLDDEPVLVLELSLTGAKVEHDQRRNVGALHTLNLGHVALRANVRFAVLLPTASGVTYQTGLEFVAMTPQQTAAIYEILIEAANEQVLAWEANLEGLPVRERKAPKSAVAQRFLWLRLTPRGWTRAETTDPNQPLDGVAVPSDESEDDIRKLCATYEKGDEGTREFLRHVATLAILERIRPR